MARHPKVFNRLYVAMVEAGEAAGILDQVLDRVAFQIEKETQIKRRVKGAMIYPTMVLIFATLVLIGMLMFLVPIFVNIFAHARRRAADADAVRRQGLELPARDYWFIIFPLLIGDVFGFRAGRRRRPGRKLWDRFKLKVPMKIGDVVLKVDDGALLADALDARRRRRRHHQGARDHRPDRRQLGRRGGARRRARAVHEGVPIAQPLIENPVFPPMVAQMVKIGEETGELEKMLGKIADFYEDEVDAAIQSLTSIIEPVMMIGVGLMVGVIIIAMYLPMFKMLTLVK